MSATYAKSGRALAVTALLAALAACGGRGTRPAASDAGALPRDAAITASSGAGASAAAGASAGAAESASGAGTAAAARGAGGADSGRPGGRRDDMSDDMPDGMPDGMPEAAVPEAAAAAYLQALDSMAAGAYGNAIFELEQLSADYPGYAGPLVNLAIAYRELERPADAELALERALALNPAHPAANNEIGILYREQGEFEAAEAAYRRAIAADPGYALAHYNLGVLLDLYLQRRDEALEEYEAYQQLADEPDASVDFWVVDLRRRLGLPTEPARLAQEESE